MVFRPCPTVIERLASTNGIHPDMRGYSTRANLHSAPWTERPHITELLNQLGISECEGYRLRTGEPFEQLVGSANAIDARALGIRL